LSNLNAFLAHLKNTYGGGGSRTHVQTYRHPKIYAHSQFYLKFI